MGTCPSARSSSGDVSYGSSSCWSSRDHEVRALKPAGNMTSISWAQEQTRAIDPARLATDKNCLLTQ